MDGNDVAVIAAGPLACRALQAAEEIRQKYGWNPAIYNIRYIKPIDTAILAEVAEKFSKVITVEDGTVIGGLHGAVAEYMSSLDKKVKLVALGVPDEYVEQGTQEEQRAYCGLTSEALLSVLLREKQDK